jgi:hypothetical protein
MRLTFAERLIGITFSLSQAGLEFRFPDFGSKDGDDGSAQNAQSLVRRIRQVTQLFV